jgi:hypothetical protein
MSFSHTVPKSIISITMPDFINLIHQYLESNNFECVDMTFCEIQSGKYQSDSVWINKNFKKI